MGIYRSLCRFTVFSFSLTFFWHLGPGDMAQQPGHFAVAPAYAAADSDGAEGGDSVPEAALKRETLSSFLKRSRDELYSLWQSNEREDTQIIIGKFTAHESDRIIEVAAKDPATARKLVPILAGTLKKETKISIFENTIKRLKARQALYEKSIKRLETEYDEAYDSQLQLERLKAGKWLAVPSNPPSEVQLNKEKIRLQRTRTVIMYVEIWLREIRWRY